MPDTRNKSKSTSHETGHESDKVKDEFLTKDSLKEILAAQEKMFKSFIDSILMSVTTRVDGLVKNVADLRASLEFTQKDVDDLKPITDELITVQQDIESAFGSIDANITKMEYLENQSRRNNIRIVGLPEGENEDWDATEVKVREMLTEKLAITAPIEIERAHRIGRKSAIRGNRSAHVKDGDTRDSAQATNGTQSKPRTVICKMKDWKQKESIVKTARRMKPTGILIFDDISSETRRKQKEQLPRLIDAKKQGKIAYFVLDKLIIKSRTNTVDAKSPSQHHNT